MPKDKQSGNPVVSRSDKPDFYANNVSVEPSVWDLKMHFSQLEQSEKGLSLEPKGTVTIPWLQAKLMAFWLQCSIEWHEQGDERIRVPKEVLPEMPKELTEVKAPSVPSPAMEIYLALYKQFVGWEYKHYYRKELEYTPMFRGEPEEVQKRVEEWGRKWGKKAKEGKK